MSKVARLIPVHSNEIIIIFEVAFPDSNEDHCIPSLISLWSKRSLDTDEIVMPNRMTALQHTPEGCNLDTVIYVQVRWTLWCYLDSQIIDLICRSVAEIRFKFFRPEIQRPFSMDYKERGSHAWGVYPTQDISRINSKCEARGKSRHKNNS